MNGTSSDPKSAQPDGEVKSKRGPGRPKGSRSTKKPNSKAAGNMHNFSQYPPPPAIPQEAGLHQQHQEYYKFQWRALNLCAEFYSAAEELIVRSCPTSPTPSKLTRVLAQKGTAPLVIAQCYQMGPGAKFDPLTMISEAKRICDSLVCSLVDAGLYLTRFPAGEPYATHKQPPACSIYVVWASTRVRSARISRTDAPSSILRCYIRC